jgi:hypothetical protein
MNGRSKNTLILAGLLFSLLASAANAALTSTAIFGPESYVRGSGQPLNIANSFTSSHPGESCLLQVYNGGLEDSEVELVSSSVIMLNGVQVVSPNEFNQTVAFIEKTVTVNASNEIAVEVRGKPGGGITVQVSCERDLEPPTIQATLSSLPNGAGWHHQDVTVTFACSDADSAITSCSAPVVVSTEGSGQLISGEAVDDFGNTASTSIEINLDKTAPQISASQLPVANLFGWNNSDVTISFSCSDALSGIAQCTADQLMVLEGPLQSVPGSAVDQAGNSTTFTHSLSIDKTAPLIESVLNLPPDANGWHSSDVTVSFSCSDTLSGINICTPPETVTVEGSGQLVTGSAEDKSGNSATTTATINLDKFEPTISATKTPPSNSDGWNNSDVTVSFDCADSGSGIATCPASIQLNTEGAGQVISGTATDLSGKSTTASTEVSIDKTPPEIIATVMPAANSAGWHNSDVEVSFSCNDEPDGSGTTSCPLTRVVTTEGVSQLESGSVLDLAGNSGTASVVLNIDKTAPTVQIDVPLNGSVVVESSVTVSGVISEVDTLVSLTVNGSSIMPDGNGNFSYTVALVEGINTLSVWATDIAGNNTNESLNVTYNPLPVIADFPALAVGSGSGAPGDVVQIPITFVSDGSVTTQQLDLLFNASQLSAGTPTAGGALGTTHGLETAQPQAGVLRIVVTPPLDNASLTSGTLAIIPFTINAAAINGNEMLMLSNSVMADGAAVEVVPDTLDSGLITITGAQ